MHPSFDMRLRTRNTRIRYIILAVLGCFVVVQYLAAWSTSSYMYLLMTWTPNEEQRVTTEVENSNHIPTKRTSKSKTNIPRVIWMFWETGWPANRPEANLALYSFQYANPDYEVRPLDGEQAEKLTNRASVIPDETWAKLKVQAKSDVYRSILLNEYGGIWADASLFANYGLDEWLDLQQTDLVSFQRTEAKVNFKLRMMRISPWITSWFLASPPKSYVAEEIVKILRNTTQHVRFNGIAINGDYFWWHRIVAGIAQANSTVEQRLLNYPEDENLQCKKKWLQAPMMKRCAHKRMYIIMATTVRCCRDQQQHLLDSWLFQRLGNLPQTETFKGLCSKWNCFNQTDNYVHRLDAVREAWGRSSGIFNFFDPSVNNPNLMLEQA